MTAIVRTVFQSRAQSEPVRPHTACGPIQAERARLREREPNSPRLKPTLPHVTVLEEDKLPRLS
jgi:hypothetical protein